MSASRVPVGAPASPIAGATPGLTGVYYQGDQLKSPAVTRIDSTIDFHWGVSAPDPSIKAGAFAVQWTGQITAPSSETYTFTTLADDGVRVWIGGKLIINDWRDHAATVDRGRITLQAGQTYDVHIQYFECPIPPATIELFWQTPTRAKTIVPASAFTTAPRVGVSSPNEGALPAAPTPPASLAATATGTNTVHLSWTDVSGETGFVVQRSTDGQTWTGIATIPSGQTRFDDSGLAPSTSYAYRVIATNAGGSSLASNVASVQTQGLIVGLTNNGLVEQINTSTGVTAQVGTLAFGTSAGDTDPLTGQVYYLEQNTSTPRVAVWNPATNTNTTLSTVSLSGPVMRAAFSPQGVLYVTAGNGDVYTINTITGAASFVGTITYNGSQLPAESGDLAFAPDGSLYLDENSDVFKVNLTTLAATYIGNNGNLGNVQAAFGTDGMLYGTVAGGELYQINTTTGAATLVGNTGVYEIGDMAAMWS